MTSTSSLLFSPNIIFDSLISIIAVNPDLLNNASISFTIVFHGRTFKKIDAASFHRCLLFGRDGIFRLTNSFSSIYVLYKLYYGDIPIDFCYLTSNFDFL